VKHQEALTREAVAQTALHRFQAVTFRDNFPPPLPSIYSTAFESVRGEVAHDG
jgi:hypothetical protein